MKLPQGKNRKRLKIAAIVVLIASGYYLVSRLIPHDDLQGLLEDISNTLGAWTYLLVGALAFLETGAGVGLVVPGETTMLLGGAVAGQGAIDLYLLLAIAWFAAWAGDTASFFIGRRLGKGFVLRHGPRVGITKARFEQVEDYFSRHGGKTILIGRFVSLVRALAPFVAGSSGMRYRAFVPYSILGTGVWSTAHILIGYFFSRSVDQAAKYAGRGVFILGTLIVTTVLVVVAVRFLRVPENRVKAVKWMEDHLLTRWMPALGRRLQPQARFIWDRLTPGGEFGLEATTMVAIFAVSTFVLVSYTVIVSGDPGPTPGDETVFDFVREISVGWLDGVAKVVTVFGSGAVTWPLTVVAAGWLASRRRWAEVAVLVVGMILIYIGVHVLKDALDRDRPSGEALVSTDGSAFPSGHAAYATIYAMLAVVIATRVRKKVVRGTPIILAGLGITALVGLSRVYLNVHYMSDVSGGWALGGAVFSLCGVVALLVVRLRDDSGGEPTRGEEGTMMRGSEA